ncbi:NACHT and WD repeat domain-containing protein [Microbacterium sp. BR1]|uniref:NACHT and WD repeat domain-containing protein n=1 Tax=Microbacterium sp. BR1 TaxID=1070896 RepID=UPI0012FDAB0B|nr:NACHT and WD repeat domain-containing protein [Microbacterium sp. BR1]
MVAIPNPGGLGDDRYESLEDFCHHVDGVADSLSDLGYEVNVPSSTWSWGAETLAAHARDFLGQGDSADVRLIHILSHGETKVGGLFPVGADGVTHRDGNVDEWLRGIEHDGPKAPSTLVVLDMCGSGLAARTTWGIEVLPEERRSWVFAASAPHRAAYDARLSIAFGSVLRAIFNGDLDVHSEVEWIPWSLVQRTLKAEVRELAQGSIEQRLHSTLIETDEDARVRFFENPAYRPPGEVARALRDAEPGVRELIESSGRLDEGHFVERASGRRVPVAAGAFSGREAQLNAIVDWMEAAPPDDSVRVVTGSPGSGKSAILGIVVCASRRFLRNRTESIWRHAGAAPGPKRFVAGIHARGLSAAVVVDSIATQLELWPDDTDRRFPPELLPGAIAELPEPAWVIIDAIDEATAAMDVLDIIDALKQSRRSDGRPACFVLVGTRSGGSWQQIEKWMESLPPTAMLHLDHVAREQIEADLAGYVARIMAAEGIEVQEGFPGDLAQKLTEEPGAEWGSFLVASLYCQVLVDRGFNGSSSEIEMVISNVPRSLPDVLELDLNTAKDGPLRRAVLTCLTWAHGVGMPQSIVQALCEDVFYDDRATPQAVRDALDGVLFYLRSSPDVSGESLYRPFHQGLVDVLRGTTVGADTMPLRILEALLARRESDDGMRLWDTAETYLLRHAPQMALEAGSPDAVLGDVEYLAHGDLGEALAAFHRVEAGEQEEGIEGSERLMLLRAILAASVHMTKRMVPPLRRQVMMVDAARYGTSISSLDTVRRLGNSLLRIDWATGNGVSPALVAEFTGASGDADAVTMARRADGRYVSISGGRDGTLRFWSLDAHSLIAQDSDAHAGPINAIEAVPIAGVMTAVSAGEDGHLRLWDVDKLRAVGAIDLGEGPIVCFSVANVAGELAAICGYESGRVTATSLSTGARLAVLPAGPWEASEGVAAIAVVGGTFEGIPVVAVSRVMGRVEVWDLLAGICLRVLIDETAAGRMVSCSALAVLYAGGKMRLVAGGVDGFLRLWDVANNKIIERSSDSHDGPISSVRITSVDGGHTIVSGGDDGTLRAWTVELGPTVQGLVGFSAAVLSMGATGQVGTIATGGADGTLSIWYLGHRGEVGMRVSVHRGSVLNARLSMYRAHERVLTVGADGTIHSWTADYGEALEEVRAHGMGLSAFVVGNLDGKWLAVSGGAVGNIRLWDASTLEPIGPELTALDGVIRVLEIVQAGSRAILLVGGERRGIELWDVTAWVSLRRPVSPNDFGDHSTVLTVVDGFPVSVDGAWDLKALREELRLGKLDSDSILSAAACEGSAGTIACLVGSDGALTAWDLEHRTTRWRFQPERSRVSSVSCVALEDRAVGVVALETGEMRVIDLADGQQIVESVASAHDGTFVVKVVVPYLDSTPVVVTGGSDGVVRVWTWEDSLIEVD